MHGKNVNLEATTICCPNKKCTKNKPTDEFFCPKVFLNKNSPQLCPLKCTHCNFLLFPCENCFSLKCLHKINTNESDQKREAKEFFFCEKCGVFNVLNAKIREQLRYSNDNINKILKVYKAFYASSQQIMKRLEEAKSLMEEVSPSQSTQLASAKTRKRSASCLEEKNENGNGNYASYQQLQAEIDHLDDKLHNLPAQLAHQCSSIKKQDLANRSKFTRAELDILKFMESKKKISKINNLEVEWCLTDQFFKEKSTILSLKEEVNTFCDVEAMLKRFITHGSNSNRIKNKEFKVLITDYASKRSEFSLHEFKKKSRRFLRIISFANKNLLALYQEIMKHSNPKEVSHVNSRNQRKIAVLHHGGITESDILDEVVMKFRLWKNLSTTISRTCIA